MDYAKLKDNADRLRMALSIAEANEGLHGVKEVQEAALGRARGYAKTILDALGDGAPWMCARCGTLHQADVGSCRACQAEIVGVPA